MRPNFEQPEFRKIYFLITQASQYHYQQIQGNSMVKFFTTEIHGESLPISMHIPVTYLMTQYFSHDFHVNVFLVKLPITSTRGLLPM